MIERDIEREKALADCINAKFSPKSIGFAKINSLLHKYADVSLKMMNSAMTPADGDYSKLTINKEDYKTIATHCKDKFESFIGYTENCKVLSEFLGFEVPMSMKQTVLSKPIDWMLVAKLPYRDRNKGEVKGLTIDDFEFSLVQYKA